MPQPTLAYRNNNPGNIRDIGTWVKGLPGYQGRGEGGFVKFSDWGMGVAAVARLLRSSRYQGKSLREIISNYAPSSENDTQRYINYVAEQAGIRPEDPVNDPITECLVMAAMFRFEGWRAK